MKREFLDNLGVDAEQIDKIMAEYGKTINPLKDELDEMNSIKTQLESQVEALTQSIDKLKDENGAEELQSKIDELKQQHNDLVAKHQEELKSAMIDHMVDSSGTNAKDYLTFELNKLEFEDGELVGVDEKLKEIQEAQPRLFEADREEEAESLKKWSQGGASVTEQASMTMDEIKKISNPIERQQAIAEYYELS